MIKLGEKVMVIHTLNYEGAVVFEGILTGYREGIVQLSNFTCEPLRKRNEGGIRGYDDRVNDRLNSTEKDIIIMGGSMTITRM